MISALILSLPKAANAESVVVLTSPRGTFRIEEQRRQGEGKMTDTWIITAWIVATADPAERLRLGGPYDDDSRRSYFISPDEKWICATVHVHSKMQGVILYRRKTGFQFELVTTDDIEDGVDQPHWVFRARDEFGPRGNPLADEIETTL